MNDRKKEVCRTLTNVLRRSPLADQIDPKSFYLMLNNNFNVLFQNETLDLRPVWDAMAASDAPPMLYGLFLGFEQAAHKRAFRVDLPAVVSALPPEVRGNYLALLGLDSDVDVGVVELQEDEEIFKTDPSATAIPLSLGSDDLKPFIPEDMRRQVVQTVVNNLKLAPIGERLDTAQLAFLVDSNFEDLCDGTTFDFGPILGGLRQLEGVQDRDVYVGVVRLENALDGLGIALAPIELNVPVEEGHELLRQLDLRERREAAVAAEATGRARSDARGEELQVPEPSGETPEVKGTARERRLRKWGLQQMSPRQIKLLRAGSMLLVLTVISTVSFFTRPNRPLSAARYSAAIPLRSAELREGAFFAVVDDSRWWDIPVETRKKKIEDFNRLLFEDGRIPNAQIRDGKGRLLMVATGGKKLTPARFFLLGDRDGNIPEERRKSMSAPAEARAAAASKTDSKDKEPSDEGNE